jgi:branched-chain amino acid transport system substrate-binding protein
MSLSGCLDMVGRSGDESTEELRVGVLSSYPDGHDFQAAEVAKEKLNEAGGIGGRDVTVVRADTNGSALEARRQYHRLVLEDDVDVTMGINTGPALKHLMDDFAEQKLLHFTTALSDMFPPEYVGSNYEKYKYQFRTGPMNGAKLIENQLAFIREMAPKLGWDSLGLLVKDAGWTKGTASAFKQQLPKLGIDVPYDYRFDPAREDYGPLYDEMEDADVDIVWPVMSTEYEPIVQWARQRRPFEFGGTHVALQLPGYYDQLGGATRYTFTYAAATPNSEITTETQKFVKRYNDMHGEDPIYLAYNMYDSFLAYKAAVEQAGTFDPDTLVETLESISVTGSTGMIEYYGNGKEYPHDRVYEQGGGGSGSLFFQWQENDDGDGVQEVFWPEEFATSEYVSPPWV